MRLYPALLVVAFLAACASSSSSEKKAQHIELVGVSLIKYDDAPSNLQVRMPQPNHKVFLISFASNTDLAAASEHHELDVHSNISICPIDQTREFSHSPDVFYQGLRTVDGPAGAKQTQYTYQVWFDYRALARRNFTFGRPDLPGYDLQKDPQDVCIALNGNNRDSEPELVSNTITVPKGLIAEALSVGLR